MGMRLIADAYAAARTAALTDQPARLLVYMAGVARDSDTDPKFYAGRDASAYALGLDPQLEATQKTVQRTVKKLIAAKLIERSETGHKGMNAVYRITLEGGHSLSPFTTDRGSLSDPLSPDKGGHSVTPSASKGGHSVSQRGSLSVPKGVTQRPPKEEEEEKEEGRVRARDTDDGYNLDTPPSPPPPDSPFCSHHDETHTGPCWACKQAREAYEAVHGKTPRRPRSPRPTSPQLHFVTENGREVCADGRHKLLADGTCAHCAIRPADLTALRGTA